MLSDLALSRDLKLPSRGPASGEACSDYLASGLIVSLPVEAKRMFVEDLRQFSEQKRPHDDADAVLKSEAKRFIQRLLPKYAPLRPS